MAIWSTAVPIGDREHPFVDGVRVCLPRDPAGDWYWTADDGLVPTGPFRSKDAAYADAMHAIADHQNSRKNRSSAVDLNAPLRQARLNRDSVQQ
jgi:hypothetical protein